MMTTDNVLPIIRSNARYDEYPFEAIDEPARGLLRQGMIANLRRKPHEASSDIERLLKILDAALQVTGRNLSVRHMYTYRFNSTCELLVGALSSSRFLEASPARRSGYIGLFRFGVLGLGKVDHRIQLHSRIFTNATSSLAQPLSELRDRFERLSLIDEKAWVWRGWTATSSAGVTTVLPLLKVYQVMGRPFTERLHASIDQYISARAAGVAPLVKELASFMQGYPETMPHELRSSIPTRLSSAVLQDKAFADRFWRGFLVWHVTTAFEAGTKMTSIAAEWNRQFGRFATEALASPNLFVIPSGGLPRLDRRGVPGERTHVRITATGEEVKCKLLTDVPLQATDEQALGLLVRDIESDLGLVTKWSRAEVQLTNARIEQRRQLAKDGKPRRIQSVGSNEPGHKWISDRENPAWIANCAATFEHYGFLVEGKDQCDLSALYGGSLSDLAEEFGLPVRDVLNPYVNLLVSEHPSMTPAFLRSIQIYDKRGVKSGISEGDGVVTLHGVKRRRGPKLAAQDIPLTPQGYELILQIIEVTKPLRDYLRKRGDGNWRYLLLSCSKGFGYPTRYRIDPMYPARYERSAQRLAEVCSVDLAKARGLVRRTSLPTIRASKAVLIYVETGSVSAMSKALGHSQCDEGLLSHYLPMPILEFFRERWIRLFQTGIILEALTGSPFRFRASAFSTLQEMDDFLKHHAIQTISLSDSDGTTEMSSKVMFGLDVDILTLLISLCSAVERASQPVGAIALYWTKIAKKLVAYIESPQCIRHDIKAYLEEARSRVDTTLLDGVLRA